jgi:adenine-specific DNA-methyltransferase
MLRPWKNLCQEFSPEHLRSVLRLAAPNFRPTHECYDVLIRDDAFSEVLQIGRIELPDARTVVVVAVRVEGDLTVRSSKAKQYDMAKRILRHTHSDAGIFAFHDDAGRFRFSLVTVTYHGTKQEYSKFRRYTFFVDLDMYNKTFFQQMERPDFSDLPNLLDAFCFQSR